MMLNTNSNKTFRLSVILWRVRWELIATFKTQIACLLCSLEDLKYDTACSARC